MSKVYPVKCKEPYLTGVTKICPVQFADLLKGELVALGTYIHQSYKRLSLRFLALPSFNLRSMES